MARRRPALILIACAGATGLAPAALADGVRFPGARPLGAGGALRAIATGDAGPQLNPSGMSLLRAFHVESAYQYGKATDSHDARISAVDSTSAFNLGGALSYAYHRASAGGVTQSGHLVGVSLSFPLPTRSSSAVAPSTSAFPIPRASLDSPSMRD